MGSTVVAIANGDIELARRAARDVAAYVWTNREQFRLRQPSPDEALRQARPLTTDPVIVEPLAEEVRALVALLAGGRQRLDALRREIEALFDQHPDAPLFRSFDGIGPKLGPRLLAYLGTDRTRFATAADLLAFGGAAPVTEASGKRGGQHARVRRRRGCRW